MLESRPRVLIDALSVTSGGGHSYAVNLIEELNRDDRGFDFTLVVARGSLETIRPRNIDVRTVRLPEFHPAMRLASRFFYEEILLPLHARRHDIVYAIADLASPLIPIPTVIALRNLNIYDHSYYDTIRLRVLEWLVRLGIRHSSRMIFPSRAAEASISSLLGLNRKVTRVVPHGVDASIFARSSERENGTPFLFLPAAIERHKNIEVLVNAIPLFGDPELEVRIAGSASTDPAYRDQLLARASELGVESRLRLIGKVPYERIVAYYRGAVAMVFPSKLETFGHPMLEAMLAGTPIVASDIPAFREIGKDVALFFPPDDATALAHAVDMLRGDPHSTSIRSAKGRERAEGYSWKRSVDTLCAVFDEILAEKGSQR